MVELCPVCEKWDHVCDVHQKCWTCHTDKEKEIEEEQHSRAGIDHYSSSRNRER